MKLAAASICLAGIAILIGACSDEQPRNLVVRTETPRGAISVPTSDPDFSTWLAPGDWVRLRGCRVFHAPPAQYYSGGKRCSKPNVVGRILGGPFDNGEDFPYYEVEGVGWVSETDLITPVDSVSFVSRTHGWAIVTVHGDGETSLHELWETNDAGDSWIQIAELRLKYAFPPRFGFTNDSHGWIASGPYNDASILESSDGGRSWTPIWQSTEPYGNDFESYSVVDALHGWRTAPYRLERTVDGGERG